ncbi:MAG TPA: DUF885 family protein [Phenylobacterium sp.]|nr:DUF885 family protein [Phenylobacterium sp.]
MLNRRELLAAGASAVAAPAFAQASTPVAQLNKLMDDVFNQMLDDSPELVTRLGFDKGPRAAAKSKLDDVSAAGVARSKARTAETLRRLKAIDRAPIAGMDAVNYDSMAYTTGVEAEADARFDYGYPGAGNPYVLSQLNGSYRETPDFLANQHTIETKADADAYLARLQAFAKGLDDETARARADHAKGVIPPDFAIERAIQQLTPLAAYAPDKSPLVRSVADRAREKGVAGDYEAQAAKIFRDEVVPALGRQIAALAAAQPKAWHDAGVWKQPDGEAYYAISLKGSTTTSMTAEEIHQTGLDQARRLSERAEALLRAQGMTQGTVGERLQALFKEPKHHYPNTDPGKEQLIADLNAMVKQLTARLPEAFATLPKAPLSIQRVPKYLEAGAPGGYYNQASLDGSRPAIYWINLRDSAEVPKWTLKTLTIHEGVPGHHLQISLQQEADLPLIRKAEFISAHGEGWALYAEELAKEMGFYENDPLGELGYLQAALFRSARLVVDTGMHAKRWSREKAIETMSSIDGSPTATATTEIERYCVWPGQACSYMVGKLTWLRLREKARAALGDRFDLKAFHDWGLLPGVMPLAVLESVIDRQIAAAKA